MPELHDFQRDEPMRGERSPAAAALVAAAERAADEILSEARADASRLRAEAGADAARTRRDADEDARGVVADARDAVDDVLRRAQSLAGELEQLGTALHRNAERILDDVRAAHEALRAEADAAAARVPAMDGERIIRRLPFEPRPDFEVPSSLGARR
jgi:cell division septum initiation protein DivIVA